MRLMQLGELAEVNPRLPKGSFNADHLVSFVPMAAVSEMSKSIVEAETRPYGEVSKGYTYFDNGDLIVAKITPCYENGKMAIVEALAHSPAFGSTEFHVIRPGKKLLGRFLFHLLQSPAVRVAGKSRMKGAAGQKRVPTDFFKDLKIPCPPIPEQKRIAAILDAADTLRAKRRETLAQLDTLLQSTFLEMFGDPVTNPKGWDDVMKLGQISNIVSGITKGRKVKPDANLREVPYLAVANVQDKHLNLENVKEILATEQEISKYRLVEGDLLLTEGGDPDKLGRGSLWSGEIDDCIHQNHVFRVRVVDRSILPIFLNWLVGSERGKQYFQRSAKQTTGIASINMTQLKGFPVLLPPLKIQEEFATIVQSIEQQKSRLRTHLDELDTLFASLQARAFAGEL